MLFAQYYKIESPTYELTVMCLRDCNLRVCAEVCVVVCGEALCGFQLILTHLDSWKHLIKSDRL